MEGKAFPQGPAPVLRAQRETHEKKKKEGGEEGGKIKNISFKKRGKKRKLGRLVGKRAVEFRPSLPFGSKFGADQTCYRTVPPVLLVALLSPTSRDRVARRQCGDPGGGGTIRTAGG